MRNLSEIRNELKKAGQITVQEAFKVVTATENGITKAYQADFRAWVAVQPVLKGIEAEELEKEAKKAGLKLRTVQNKLSIINRGRDAGMNLDSFKSFGSVEKALKDVSDGVAKVSDGGTVVTDEEAKKTAQKSAKNEADAEIEEISQTAEFKNMMNLIAKKDYDIVTVYKAMRIATA